jgi:hypothetical protein
MLRQQLPDVRIFLAQHPGAEALQILFFDKTVALFKGTGT